jgi:hypothetical protein
MMGYGTHPPVGYGITHSVISTLKIQRLEVNIDDSRSYIGGWGDIDGHHFNIEHEGLQDREESGLDLLYAASEIEGGITESDVYEVDYVQVHIIGDDYDAWVTIHGPWETLDDMYEQIAEVVENEGGS